MKVTQQLSAEGMSLLLESLPETIMKQGSTVAGYVVLINDGNNQKLKLSSIDFDNATVVLDSEVTEDLVFIANLDANKHIVGTTKIEW